MPPMQLTLVATIEDQNQGTTSFLVDTDTVYFIINNSANGAICNIKSMFVGDFKHQNVILVTVNSKTITVK
jgi:hypothetical protein